MIYPDNILYWRIFEISILSYIFKVKLIKRQLLWPNTNCLPFGMHFSGAVWLLWFHESQWAGAVVFKEFFKMISIYNELKMCWELTWGKENLQNKDWRMIKRKEFDGKRKKTVTRIHSLKEFIKPAKEEKKLYSQKKTERRLKRIK